MCPYCGEDVPDDSSTCWKCGTELSESETEVEGGDEGIEVRGSAKAQSPKRPCPFCETMVPVHALRCGRCGKVLKEAAKQVKWPKAVYTAFGAVVLLTVVGFIYALATHRATPHDPARLKVVQASFSQLSRIYLGAAQGTQESRRRQTWELEHVGKYVEWEGFVTRIADPDLWLIELASSPMARVDRPEVRLTFKRVDDPTSLKEGKSIRYSARLVAYHPDAGFFELDDGLLLTETPPAPN